MRNFGIRSPAKARRATPVAPSDKPRASKTLIGLARSFRRPLLWAAVAPLLAGLLLVPQAWLLSGMIQRALVQREPTDTLYPTVAAIAALIALRAILIWAGESCGSHAALRIVAGLRQALFRHLLAQRPDWSAARASGALSSAIVDQVGAFEGFFARYLPSMSLATVLPLVFAASAFVVDPVVGGLFLVSAPLIPVFMALVGWGAEAANKQHQQAFLRLSGFFADRLRGLVTLKLLGRAEAEAQSLRQAGDELRARTLGVLRIAFLSSAVLEFFAALGVASVALYVGLTYLGFLHLHAAPMTLQAGLFCLLMAPEVYLPLRQFAAHYHDRAAAVAAVEGLQSLFETLPALTTEDAEPDQPARLSRGALPVLVTGLTLATPDGQRPILREADLAVPSGSHIAILGASGTGKSTFLEALAGLRAGTGHIELGGVPLAEIPEPELRAQIAMLGQRPRLFQGTIADNIRLGRSAASDEEVTAAAERACVMRFVADLPDGLGTSIGEGGLGLSGGEAHRVALARIFLRDPDLILLDEPTAHLDAHTETDVLDGIIDFAAGRTLIVATHSSAVAECMDRVLRIESHKLFATPHRRRSAANHYRKGVA